MQEEMREYATFITTNKEGNEMEMAVVDEFEFEHKHYVVGALIEDDTINEEGLFIFKLIEAGEEITVEKISNPTEYQKIAEAYMEIE